MRDDRQRLNDIIAAAEVIDDDMARGVISDGLIFDAVRVRLIEIGEAVKAVDSVLLAEEPGVPWNDIAGMRDNLAHRYFDTVTQSLPQLSSVIYRHSLTPSSGSSQASAARRTTSRGGALLTRSARGGHVPGGCSEAGTPT